MRPSPASTKANPFTLDRLVLWLRTHVAQRPSRGPERVKPDSPNRATRQPDTLPGWRGPQMFDSFVADRALAPDFSGGVAAFASTPT